MLTGDQGSRMISGFLGGYSVIHHFVNKEQILGEEKIQYSIDILDFKPKGLVNG